ncbi:DUF397 domain-containing protein [Nocardiopsis sp. FIRDI 009]|uniref:DUF397 domain-containing protein n=1 Tax=Nocardiopsis sp. FIRDI 009 TaxID=714197 RepID=UPI0018E515BB|nr:DUF397 domain-containing protein [Nocardiopsis sp. FIRDI 009]
MNDWHKSSYSHSGAQCVEVREHPTGADVRDTQNRDAGHLTFPRNEWQALVTLAQRA